MFDAVAKERIQADVVKRLAIGEPLTSICRTDGYPDPSTVWDWRANDPQFYQAIARAREIGFDAIADDCVGIADDGRNDWMAINGDDDVGWRANGDHIQRSRLRVDTRLKLLAKWDPKRYGDKLQVDQDLTVRVVIDDPFNTMRASAVIEHAASAALPKPSE